MQGLLLAAVVWLEAAEPVAQNPLAWHPSPRLYAHAHLASHPLPASQDEDTHLTLRQLLSSARGRASVACDLLALVGGRCLGGPGLKLGWVQGLLRGRGDASLQLQR